MRNSRTCAMRAGAIVVCVVAQVPSMIVDQAGFVRNGISFFRFSKSSINARNSHEFRIFG